MADVLSVAEEFLNEKQEANQKRNQKLVEDRKEHNDRNLAQTEGLKPIRIRKNKRQQFVEIDEEFEVDLTRVRKFSDVTR